MLFQMCYGPEIQRIYEVLLETSLKEDQLCELFQYRSTANIESLVHAVITFLSDLGLVIEQDKKYSSTGTWDELLIPRSLQKNQSSYEENSLDHVFVNIYPMLFVHPNTLFVSNLHHAVNSLFPRTVVSEEKVNAWKRMMEFFGFGYRAFGGFYSLPHLSVIKTLINNHGKWNGPLQVYCEEFINPVIPCITKEGSVFKGTIHALGYLSKTNAVTLSSKQDLPYSSYGSKWQWNWIQVEG